MISFEGKTKLLSLQKYAVNSSFKTLLIAKLFPWKPVMSPFSRYLANVLFPATILGLCYINNVVGHFMVMDEHY